MSEPLVTPGDSVIAEEQLNELFRNLRAPLECGRFVLSINQDGLRIFVVPAVDCIIARLPGTFETKAIQECGQFLSA